MTRDDLRAVVRNAPLAVETMIMLTLASLAVRWLPRRRLVRLLGLAEAPGDGHRPGAPAKARKIGHVVERVAARLPWKPVCLPQALATLLMLRWRGIACQAHLGIVSTRPFDAHAWVSVGGTVVQGGSTNHATEVAILR